MGLLLLKKKIHITKTEAEEFYKVHQTKPFYNDLCEYLSSGPILVMILEKFNAILDNRELMGSTDPKKANEGTIRKKYGISIDKNSVHGSDSFRNAKKERYIFFLKIRNKFFYSFRIENMLLFKYSLLNFEGIFVFSNLYYFLPNNFFQSQE